MTGNISLLMRVAGLLLLLSGLAYAGGPRYVAGVSYFDPAVKGVPLTWAQGAVNYYTDQGDLSPILPHAAADAFVGDAFSRWTSTPTAAVSATLAGQLAEDVSGSNVTANSDGTVSMPADILPSAVTTPVAVVYDADGAVTDALLGQGAGGASYCFTNAVFGGPDNFSADAHLVHALLVLNGNCAQNSAQLTEVKYRLVRAIGRVFGLDWSQLNVNVITGKPSPTAADAAGFPVMHGLDPSFCAPVSNCYPNADQPKADDQAALSRLYPVTTQNSANFPGKQLCYENTIRIRGSVYFADSAGKPKQPMQGVNVVARWIDPSTGQPSGTYAASSVSGFIFRGNAGNPATGFTDAAGLNYDRFGSNDPTLEGYFDLAGLPIPNGADSAQYQISVEAVDPVWSQWLNPYGPLQVQPSGTAQSILVTATRGASVQQDILMLGSATEKPDRFEPTSYAVPAAVPPSGEWQGSLSGYGNGDFFSFSGQSNRTLSVEVTALDESSAPSQNKARPVIGMWTLADPGTYPAPANTSAPFNTLTAGVTRLDAVFLQSTSFRVGIVDFRGDGRPDYRYRGRIFYGDRVSPSRVSASGGTVFSVRGLGFHSNVAARIGSIAATVLATSSNQILLSPPGQTDGVQDVTLTDPATGATSTMTGVLTYGAGPDDLISLIVYPNSAVPVGAQAAYPIVAQVLAPDGITPVSGARVYFSSQPAASLAACNGASACTVFTDQSGRASTFVTVLAPGTTLITAQLAPASYSPAKQAQIVISGTSSALDLALTTPRIWVVQGATIDVPLAVRALSNGSPLGGQTVSYTVSKGPGSFNNSNSTTDSTGYATATLHLANVTSQVTGSACVTYNGLTTCQTFNVFPVQASALQLQIVSGNGQEVSLSLGQSFAPLIVRVTDSSSPPNPVLGAGVVFQSSIGRAPDDTPVISVGTTEITRNPMPVILATAQAAVAFDQNGLAAVQPTAAGVQGPVLILGTATAGVSSVQFQLQSIR